MRPLRRLPPVLLLVALAACVSVEKRSELQERVGGTELSPAALRTRVRDLLPRFAGTLELLADEIAQATDDAGIRAAMARFKIEAISQLQLAVYRPDPVAALVDTWALVAQLDQAVDGLAEAAGVGPEAAALADERFSAMEAELAALWSRLTGKEDVGPVRERVRAWAAEHPLDAIGTRETTVPLLAEITAGEGRRLGAFAGELQATAQDAVDRLDQLAVLLPKRARWETEYLLERDLDRLAGRTTREVVDEALDAAAAPENLARLETVMEAAVAAALRGSLRRAEGDEGARGAVIPVSAAGRPVLVPASLAPLIPESLATQLGQAMARAFADELAEQLGPDGRGPLGTAIAETTARSAAAAVEGVAIGWRGEDLPACEGKSRDECIQLGLRQLGGTVAGGATRGVKGELPLTPVLLGFALGAGAAALVALGWFLRGRRVA